MQVTGYELSMSAEHVRQETLRESSRLQWQGPGTREGRPETAQGRQQDAARISSRGRQAAPRPAAVKASDAAKDEGPLGDLRMNLLKAIVERFTGREIKVLRPEDVAAPPESEQQAATKAADEPAVKQEQEQEQEQGWGLRYDYYQERVVQESTQVSMNGRVTTADGEQIDIGIDVSLSRTLVQRQEFHLQAGDALQDPLVLNFDGGSAELTQRQFAFDLDVDGREDQIAFVRPGSGFLVLDRNQDGQVNNGSELFGPQTGNGFQELAAFDEDGNAWIDANDSIYSQLRIWEPSPEGGTRLVGLGQKGVGALYLGHIDSPFLLHDNSGEEVGRLRSSSLFLAENGGSGLLQQLDLRA